MYGFSGVGERGADELGASQEELYRTLVVSNLVAIHLKSGVGPLPAYRRGTSAGCGAGAGVTYLCGGRFYEIARTIANAMAINSGMICGGASGHADAAQRSSTAATACGRLTGPSSN